MNDSYSENQKENTENDHEEETAALSKKHAKKTEERHQVKEKLKLTKQIRKTKIALLSTVYIGKYWDEWEKEDTTGSELDLGTNINEPGGKK